MKKIYISSFLLCMAMATSAQKIIAVSPYAIPASGSVTVTIVGHNTFFLSHPVSYARLTQPDNSDGSVFTSVSETVISNDSMTATFNISNPAHGGFYNVSVVASSIYINTRQNGVYMTGKEPRRISSATPNYGAASATLTTTISGSQMHFLSSTGYPHIGSVQIKSEIDNTVLYNSGLNYIDSNNVNVEFTLPYNATNGIYTLDVDMQNLYHTSRTNFITVTGGVKKKIVSVNPPSSMKGDSVQMIVRVTGRNLITNPVTSAVLSSELSSYSLTIYSQNISVIDSNHVRIKTFISTLAAEGDYYLTLNGFPSLIKHFAFRVVPPDIKGIIYQDADSNGVMNGSEHGLGGRKVLLLPDSIYAFTDQNGNYFYYTDPGTYTVKYVQDTVYQLTSSPSSYNVTVVDTAQSGFNFGIYKMPTFEHIFYASQQNMRCNTTTNTFWYIYNPEDVVHQGTVTLVHSPNLTVTWTSIAPNYTNGDTMVWNYNINPMSALQCNVQFLSPAAGNTVWYKYTDHIANHNYNTSFTAVVTCSWDPNDKSVQPQETPSDPTTLVTEVLEYNINFQNTGNDTAFRVMIEDTLNPFLDLSTFEIIGSSHPMVANLDYPNRVVNFIFENILLADSNIDEPNSHGYVRYRIKPLQGIPDSVTVSNTAYIYFDFNPAVITNTATSHLVYFKLPQASATTASSSICMLNCINFNSTSIYATSWQWSFPGGVPSSSTDENPQGICYLNTGNYDVTLIATNGFGSDTISLPSYLTVNALPPPPVLFISNDTIFCVIDPNYTSYQWYDTTGMISGATNSYYVPPFTGLFGLSVYNQQGCEAASSMPINVSMPEYTKEEFYVFPNPAEDQLGMHLTLNMTGCTIEILNLPGEKIKTAGPTLQQDINIDIRNLSPGIYFVRFQNQERTFEKRFVKN